LCALFRTPKTDILLKIFNHGRIFPGFSCTAGPFCQWDVILVPTGYDSSATGWHYKRLAGRWYSSGVQGGGIPSECNEEMLLRSKRGNHMQYPRVFMCRRTSLSVDTQREVNPSALKETI
jgi:hypothetical protein